MVQTYVTWLKIKMSKNLNCSPKCLLNTTFDNIIKRIVPGKLKMTDINLIAWMTTIKYSNQIPHHFLAIQYVWHKYNIIKLNPTMMSELTELFTYYFTIIIE